MIGTLSGSVLVRPDILHATPDRTFYVSGRAFQDYLFLYIDGYFGKLVVTVLFLTFCVF